MVDATPSDNPPSGGGAPIAPPNANLESNKFLAKLVSTVGTAPVNYLWLYMMVRNNGPWDYKQINPSYANFGNYNYGAVAATLGVPLDIALRAAGVAQIIAKTSNPAFGNPLGSPPYGDDPNDQAWIKLGYTSVRH